MNIYLVATIFANAKDKDFFVHLFFVCVHEWNELLENIDVTSNAVMEKCRDFATDLQPISTPMATRRRPRMWKGMKR